MRHKQQREWNEIVGVGRGVVVAAGPRRQRSVWWYVIVGAAGGAGAGLGLLSAPWFWSYARALLT